MNKINEWTSELPENPLLLHPLTSSINPNNNTMATLYGNDLATDHVNDYPAGAVLYEITWSQKPDSLWFGGNVPGDVLSVEQIIFNDNGKPTYKLYKGNIPANDEQERMKFIISQRPAVSP
ncbi:MAG: hypothetical protein V4541_11275 [Bacteroidota bacterium]